MCLTIVKGLRKVSRTILLEGYGGEEERKDKTGNLGDHIPDHKILHRPKGITDFTLRE